MHRNLVAFFVLSAAALGYAGRIESVPELPEFLRKCRRSDPNLDECVKRTVESLRPHLRTGLAELGIPSCEPLSVPQVELAQASGPVSIRSNYTNIKVWGGTDFILKNVKIDLDKDRIRLKLFVPRLEMQSNYQMEGKILMLPIVGNGMSYGNYTDIDVVATVQAERYRVPRTGKEHWRVIEFFCDFDVGNARVHLDNLFNGDETLADAMNLFLNDNWKTVAAEIKPALELSVQRLFKSFANKLFSKYSIDTLLPE